MADIVRRQASAEPLSGLDPILQRIFANRGIKSEHELEHVLNHLHSFNLLKDIDKAVALLANAYEKQSQITIVGDYDADGATASSVGVKGFKLLGFSSVNFVVPNRFTLGYGLSPPVVDLALTHNGTPHNPGLLITVDNGISSIDGVAYAKEKGFEVLVTDHHLAGTELPAADAIVNPNQPGCDFPSKGLAGVGVIFYVLMALRANFRALGAYENCSEPNLAQLLDLVALGTVADLVPLDHNNRILVAQGVKRIRAGKACPGIQALLKIARRDASELHARDLGFSVGPRLNAAGRLDDMSIGIQCLLADNTADASALAERLDLLNQERRTIEQSMKEQALSFFEHVDTQSKTADYGIAIFHEDWHQGVIGILASRIKERFHRPVIAFAPGDESILKGSARSIPGFNIRDALAEIASSQPGLIKQFGGHAMAAGLSLDASRFKEFQAAFNSKVRERLSDEQLEEKIFSDGSLALDKFTLDFAHKLKHLAPWGQLFPEPSFDGLFHVVHQSIVGKTHLKLRLSPLTEEGEISPHMIEAIAFNVDPDLWQKTAERVNLVFTLDINAFRDQRKVQLLVQFVARA